jgi:hypothetical protein
MPYTDPTLAWLEILYRRESVARPGGADAVPAGPAAPAPVRAPSSADPADTGLAPASSAPASPAPADLTLDDELQRRLGQVVFSTLCEKLGRPKLTPILGRAEAEILTADHLRAARALLNWSMSDLALESGLSVSTIKRAETLPQDVTRRSYRLMVETLQGGGIRFLTLDDGTVAVAKGGQVGTGSLGPLRKANAAHPAPEPGRPL